MIIIEAKRVVSRLTGTDLTPGSTDNTRFLVDNSNDVITLEIDVRFETVMAASSLSSTALPAFFIQTNARNQFTGKEKDARSIFTNNPDGWNTEEYHVGDFFVLQGMQDAGGTNNKTGQIIEISEDRTTLITDQTFTTETFPITDGNPAYIAITTGITAITHKHGLIENEEDINYESKVDGSEQIAQIGGLSFTNTSFQTAELLGNKSWQFGSVQVKGNNQGIGNPAYPVGVLQAFTIRHELIINPFILFDEFDDAQNGLKPDRLKDQNSLRYVFSVQTSAILNDPNDNTLIVSDELDQGNVGYKGENFNGGATNYSFSNLQYKDLFDVVRTGLELTTNVTKITYSVFNTEDSPFSLNNTKMVFAFNFAPSAESQYRDDVAAITKLMEDNFIYDDNFTTLTNSISGSPRQTGTDLQVIKSVVATFISSSQIDIEVRIEMATDVVTRISLLTTKQFQIYMSIADHTLLRKDSDKMTLDLDNDVFFIETTDPTMISLGNTFMPHTGSVIGTDNFNTISARAEDDIVCITNFDLDKNGRETDDIQLTGVTGQIIARLDANTFFEMDEVTIPLTDSEIITDPTFGGIPFVDFTQDRGFRTPADALRQNTRLKRRTDLDGGGKFSYEFRMPVGLRWEDWEPNPDANDAFFDITKLNNGKNHDWIRIAALAGWDVKYKVTITALKNGDPQTYTGESIISMEDYKAGTEWNAENQKSFVQSSGDEIGSGSDRGISGYENTRIESNMTYIGPGSFVPADLVAVMKINVFQKGNFKEQFTLSSLYPPHPDTIWLGLSPATKVVITNPSGSIFRSAALLQFDKLDPETTFKITHRLYAPPFSNVKLLSQGGDKLLSQGGGVKLLS